MAVRSDPSIDRRSGNVLRLNSGEKLGYQPWIELCRWTDEALFVTRSYTDAESLERVRMRENSARRCSLIGKVEERGAWRELRQGLRLVVVQDVLAHVM
jgi:hypothetical protein